MSYLILYFLLAGLCVFNLRWEPAAMKVETVMNRLNKLRFVFAILIIFTHCTLPYGYLPRILLPLRKISTFGVGYFFICSGYGLAYSVAHKPHYLDDFWKKIANLLWLTVFSSVVSGLIKNIAFGQWNAFQLINWYMPAMIVLYGLFLAAYRVFPEAKNKRNIFLGAAVFAAMALVCWVDHITGLNHRNYYISEWAFPFGVFIFEYADAVADFLKKKFSLVWIILAELAFGGLALVVPEKGLLDLVFHNLMLLPVGLGLMWMMDKLVVDNVVLKKMNRYTLFIYLFQFPILEILKNYYITQDRPFDVLWFLGCLGLTCVLAVVLQTLYYGIGKALRKQKS